MRFKGKVIKWFDDKGYGFISTGDVGDKVFAHITAFPDGGERPKFAEEVTYELTKDAKNRMKAANILYVNRPDKELTLVNERPKEKYRSIKTPYKVRPGYKNNKTSSFSYFWVAIFVVLSLMILSKYHHLLDSLSFVPERNVRIQKNSTELKNDFINSNNSFEVNHFQCKGKTHCGEMTSCEEAKFYLNNCSGSISDGDGDGIPCEDQWCGH